eukprot:IDg19239t1
MLKGSKGLPLLGETLPFVKDPIAFVDERVAQHGPVFRSNVLGQSTVFACSRAAALDALCAAGTSCERAPETEQASMPEAGAAYAEFLGPLYPEKNLLLLNSDSAEREQLVRVFECALDAHAVRAYRAVVTHVVERDLLSAIRTRANKGGGFTRVALYATLKPVCERLVATVVLGDTLGEAR